MSQASRNTLPAAVALAVLSIVGLFVAARAWLADIYTSIGPVRSADFTLAISTTACASVIGTLLAVLALWAAFGRSRRQMWPPDSRTALMEPPDSTTTLSGPSGRVIRLPAGNWANGNNIAQSRAPRDVVELDFVGRPAVVVPRTTFFDALRMPQLRRAAWRHDTNAYRAIRQYLLDRGAIDERGRWVEARRDAILRMAE